MKKSIVSVGLAVAALSTVTASADTIRFDKRGTNFSIDGNNGARQGQQIYLYSSSDTNVNQQWEETQVDDRFYMYQKEGTNVCIDGMGGGERGQVVHLWPCNSSNENQHWEKISVGDGYTRLKKRGVSFSLDCQGGGANRQTCHLWDSQDSNINQHFMLADVDDNGGGGDGGGDNGGGNNGGGTGDFGLNPNADPWENFDLRFWKIDTPAGEDSASDCEAQSTEPDDWDSLPNSRSDEFFFTHTDGGMRFISEFGGGTTGGDCDDKSRSELREMLRGSNRNIDTTGGSGDFRNNWALEYQPNNADADETWGARGGKMSATLIVNDVTESGSNNDQGNIVIGQIHASSDEPLRLHYRIRPGMSRGCIWASSEIRNGDDVTFEIVGTRNCTSNPDDGIALGEMFSYEIENVDEDIIVTIREGDQGSIIERETIDLDQLNSGYDRDDEWMYFKAGVYSQNDDGDRGDRDIVTFYRLDIEH